MNRIFSSICYPIFYPTLAFVTLFFIMSGCARVTASTTKINQSINQRGGGLSVSKVSPASVLGTWTNECAYDGATGAYYTGSIEFQGETMITTSTKFLDSLCATPQYKETRISGFSVAAEASNQNTTNINETLSSVSFDVLTPGMVTLFNQGNYCGSSNWALNVSQTILNDTSSAAANCANLPLTQVFHSTLYGNTELYLDNCATASSVNCTTIEYTKSSN